MKLSAKRSTRRKQRESTYDSNSSSKYSQKKALQAKGIYSKNSPFKCIEVSVVTQEVPS